MTTYDVIIIGGGIVGVSTAYVLAQRQKNVLLLEQFVPAHQRGSSHGDGRMTRYAYGANEAVYLEMVKRSFAS
jgi:sarcosine oxidase/N-methyl-L-tryptophan oxidase